MTNLRVVRSGPRENAGDYTYEEIHYRRSPPRQSTNEESVISKLMSNAVIHALEALLTAILSPIMIWQWLSKHDHLMTILRVVFEVLLELVMLIVFAGVSILTAAALIFDDLYTEQATHSSKAMTEAHNNVESVGKAQKDREKPITPISGIARLSQPYLLSKQ